MFSGKVVLITGASSGIGEHTAREFSKLGASVVITGRNIKALEEVAESCQKVTQNNTKPLIIIADMTNKNDIENIIKTTIDHFKKLDVLVNNADISAVGSIENTTIEQFDEIMSVNLRGPYYLTMLSVPHLIKAEGNIVNVSSVAGIRSFPNMLAYGISKSALDQFTKCLAIELGLKGVRVNAINPGVLSTDIQKFDTDEAYNKETLNNCLMSHAIRRSGFIDEVSPVIVFLASNSASNITGVTLSVDGGRHVMNPTEI